MISVYNHLKFYMEVIGVPMLTSSLGLGAIMYMVLPFIWVTAQLLVYAVLTVKHGWDGFIVSLLTALFFNVPLWYLTH